MLSDWSFEAGSNALSDITSTGTLGQMTVPIPVNAIGGLNRDNLEVLSGQSICSRSDMEGAAMMDLSGEGSSGPMAHNFALGGYFAEENRSI